MLLAQRQTLIGTCVREHSGGHPPKSRPSRHPGRAGSGHGRPHGGGPSAPRACTPERRRADAGPARAVPRHREAMLDPISEMRWTPPSSDGGG